jgi:large subunit ribosomal protein L35
VPQKARKGKYKIKTHKATAKRFKITGSGKLMRSQGPKSHLRRKKSARTKVGLSQMTVVSNNATVKRVRKLAPYLKKHKSNPPG